MSLTSKTPSRWMASSQETGPPELGERHPFFVLSFSAMIYGLVGTAAVLVMFFASFWLGMALMALAAAGSLFTFVYGSGGS